MKPLSCLLFSVTGLLFAFVSDVTRPPDGYYKGYMRAIGGSSAFTLSILIDVKDQKAIADLFLFRHSYTPGETLSDTMLLNTDRQIYLGKHLMLQDWFGKWRVTTIDDKKVFMLYNVDAYVRLRDTDNNDDLRWSRNGLLLTDLRNDYLNSEPGGLPWKKFEKACKKLHIEESQETMEIVQFKLELEKLRQALAFEK